MYLLPPWRFYPRNFVSCKAVFINFLVIYPKHGGEKFWRCVQLFRHSIGWRQTGGRTTDGHKCPINIAPLVYRYWRALKTKKKKNDSYKSGRHVASRRSNMSSRLSENISEKMRDIIHRFVSRTERFKERAIQPPTPSTGELTTGLFTMYLHDYTSQPTHLAQRAGRVTFLRQLCKLILTTEMLM